MEQIIEQLYAEQYRLCATHKAEQAEEFITALSKIQDAIKAVKAAGESVNHASK